MLLAAVRQGLLHVFHVFHAPDAARWLATVYKENVYL